MELNDIGMPDTFKDFNFLRELHEFSFCRLSRENEKKFSANAEQINPHT